MSGLSTHVLDTARGCPADGVAVRLERAEGTGWRTLRVATTDDDGRVARLLGDEPLAAGIYRLTFATGDWAAAQGATTFYPEAAITFRVDDPTQHHHVPLLLSPFGYTTYRGS